MRKNHNLRHHKGHACLLMIKNPKNWKEYREFVLNKITAYCESNIWCFDAQHASNWLENFAESEENEYLAVRLLDSIIYRSNEMAISSYQRYFSTCLKFHHEKTCQAENLDLESWLDILKKGNGRINATFVGVKSKSDTGESAGHIIRILNRSLLNARHVKSITELSKQETPPQLMVFVDDMIGSGDQFCQFAKENNLSSLSERTKILYCPLLALPAGVETITQAFPNIVVEPLEMISRENKVFVSDYGDGTKFKNDPMNTVDDFKNQYIEFMKQHVPNMNDHLGRDGAEVSIVFEWGCPNQTLPIFWMNSTKIHDEWIQLFTRRA